MSSASQDRSTGADASTRSVPNWLVRYWRIQPLVFLVGFLFWLWGFHGARPRAIAVFWWWGLVAASFVPGLVYVTRPSWGVRVGNFGTVPVARPPDRRTRLPVRLRGAFLVVVAGVCWGFVVHKGWTPL